MTLFATKLKAGNSRRFCFWHAFTRCDFLLKSEDSYKNFQAETLLATIDPLLNLLFWSGPIPDEVTVCAFFGGGGDLCPRPPFSIGPAVG